MQHPRLKLKPKNLILLKNCISVTILWVAMMYLYMYFTWWGLDEFLKVGPYTDYLHSYLIHGEILIQGVVFGILFGLINFFTDKSVIRKKSFGAIVIIKSLFYIMAVFISMGAVFAFYYFAKAIPMETIAQMQKDLTATFIISVSVYVVLSVVFINLLIQINRKFGHGVLWRMFVGTYHKPKNEHRIFMFLDLQNSTGLAETLGHYNYSRFIQACIHDLTEIIIRYKAQVYQYVGDEIVLTWPAKTGIRNYNCISLFYAYEQRLYDRRKKYLSAFNCVPKFKAGLDEGIITVTEVGDIKREIAYHGAVLNTASRLEKLCNKLDKSVLISDRLFKRLPVSDTYEKVLVGQYQLRGKDKKEKVYGIERIN